MSPLMLAARVGHLGMVKELLKNKADINQVQNCGLYRGVTALWYAARSQHWDVALELLTQGVSNLDACPIGGKNSDGQVYKSGYHGIPVLWLAKFGGEPKAVHQAVLQKLRDEGATEELDPEKVDEEIRRLIG